MADQPTDENRGRGRPPNENETIHISIRLSLHPGRDDDLIAFFNSLPWGTRAAAVMAAMRSGNLTAVADEDYQTDDQITEKLDALMM
jgi:ABC-type phosphate/phosphonate transport system substrate-binding protein